MSDGLEPIGGPVQIHERERGVTIVRPLSFDEWRTSVLGAWNVTITAKFVTADLLNYGDETFGEDAAAILTESMWTEGTVRNLKWVGRHVPMQNRTFNLSWSHYQAVAPIEDKQVQREVLYRAELEGWGRDQLRKHLLPTPLEENEKIVGYLVTDPKAAVLFLVDFINGKIPDLNKKQATKIALDTVYGERDWEDDND